MALSCTRGVKFKIIDAGTPRSHTPCTHTGSNYTRFLFCVYAHHSVDLLLLTMVVSTLYQGARESEVGVAVDSRLAHLLHAFDELPRLRLKLKCSQIKPIVIDIVVIDLFCWELLQLCCIISIKWNLNSEIRYAAELIIYRRVSAFIRANAVRWPSQKSWIHERDMLRDSTH